MIWLIVGIVCGAASLALMSYAIFDLAPTTSPLWRRGMGPYADDPIEAPDIEAPMQGPLEAPSRVAHTPSGNVVSPPMGDMPEDEQEAQRERIRQAIEVVKRMKAAEEA